MNTIVLIGICIVSIFSTLLISEGDARGRGSEDRQIGQVPIKDGYAFGGNNMTINPFDFSKRDRRVFRGRRRQQNRNRSPYYRRRYGRHGRRRFDSSSSESDSSSQSRSYESYEDYWGRDPCKMRLERGSCPDMQTRYWYNSHIGECKSFRYGGCGGNANNFVTLENCQNYCGGGAPPKPMQEQKSVPATKMKESGSGKGKSETKMTESEPMSSETEAPEK